MICCPCFGAISSFDDEPNRAPILHKRPAEPYKHANNHASRSPTDAAVTARDIQAQSFTFRELATATKHFTPESLVGEGGRGRVYKGLLENGGHGQAVAIKQLDRNSMGDATEFLVEVLMLSLLRHPNLVNLIGYCADGDQRLLVYELMPSGSLHDHLHCLPPGRPPLDWCARMRIASGAAQGLEYLHDRADPPVVCRDLKSSGILLDGRLTPKLSDFGHASVGPTCGRTVSRAMSTYGYSAPEYARNGELTMKSDVYSFGVVLLELITGRRALDPAKPTNEQNLVSWAQPMFKEQRRYPELVDPVLRGKYPLKALNQAVAIAAMCLQDEASVRPLMADVVITISFLTEPTPLPEDHVVETLQLGRSKRAPAPKPVSRCSSTGSSSGCSDDGSSSMHSQGLSSSSEPGSDQGSDCSMRSARADESD